MDKFSTMKQAKGEVIDTVRVKSLPTVAYETLQEIATGFFCGNFFSRSKPALFVWRWVMNLFFFYLAIGAFVSFCITVKGIGKTPINGAHGYEIALNALGQGCEFFFHYVIGAPRVVFCKFIEALLGCGAEASLRLFYGFLMLLGYLSWRKILRNYRTQGG